ncbi:MAG: hypothetical protein ACD_17C00384G0001 [uncultured bacterium]|nr:MAG: hypothetical protein ACD_17C00384G0001 [uncultured bacterium]
MWDFLYSQNGEDQIGLALKEWWPEGSSSTLPLDSQTSAKFLAFLYQAFPSWQGFSEPLKGSDRVPGTPYPSLPAASSADEDFFSPNQILYPPNSKDREKKDTPVKRAKKRETSNKLELNSRSQNR